MDVNTVVRAGQQVEVTAEQGNKCVLCGSGEISSGHLDTCRACPTGEYRETAETCAQCTAIDNSVIGATITCSSDSDSTFSPGSSCIPNYYIDNAGTGTADVCTPCSIRYIYLEDDGSGGLSPQISI